MSTKTFDVAVIGNWHLAFVTAGCLASKGLSVALVNPDPKGWSGTPSLPVIEPGLQEMIETAMEKGLFEYRSGIHAGLLARFAWLAIDTPVNDRDEADVSSLDSVAATLRENRIANGNLILNSQVPMGYCAAIEKKFGLKLCYIPENLRLGKGVETFLKADRTVLGASDVSMRTSVRQMLSFLETEFIECDLPTAEMIKHATNAFLATSISFANEFARLGEKFGVDNQLVGKALKTDKRIGRQAYVIPGLGFAGGTLPRDLRVMQRLGRETHVPTPLADAVLEINEATSTAILDVIRDYVGDLRGKEILILGYTYKAETDALRRSLSIELSELLEKAGATVWGYDPLLNGRDLSLFGTQFKHFDRIEDLPREPHVAVVMTPRPAFAEINWDGLNQRVDGEKVSLVFDTRSYLNPETILSAGLAYKALWQPVLVEKGNPLCH